MKKIFLVFLLIGSLGITGCEDAARKDWNAYEKGDYADSVLNMQGTVSGSLPVIGESGENFVNKINNTSDSMKFKFIDPGELFPALDTFDAISSGSIQSGWSTSAYWAGKNRAFQLFASIPFYYSIDKYLDWMWNRGGYEIMNDVYKTYHIKGIPCSMITSEGFGWFLKPINSSKDLVGLKMRFFGLGAKVMEKAGVSTQLLKGGDIYPALELGMIDATEFSTPFIDVLLEFYEVAKYYYYPTWHNPFELITLMINIDVWESLTDKEQVLIINTCKANIEYHLNIQKDLISESLEEIKKEGVIISEIPLSIEKALKQAWNEVLIEERKDITFNRVWLSLMKQ